MADRSFRRGSPQVRAPRRTTNWAAGVGGSAVTGISATTPTFIGSSITPTVPGLTVIRQRGHLRVVLTVATAAGDGFIGAFGIGIASLAAVTAGVSSVPTPITEIGAENWLYWTPIQLIGQQLFASGAGPGAEQLGTFVDIEIDTKAMRKFPPDTAIYAMIEFGTETGTASCNVFFDSRVLFKLP